MKEKGKVVQVKGDSVIIEILPKEACTKCHSCKASMTREVIISGEQAKFLKLGDHVEVDVDPSLMMRLYLLLYALPLAAFFTSVITIYIVFRSPILSFIGALAVTIILYILIGRYIRRKRVFSPNVCVKG